MKERDDKIYSKIGIYGIKNLINNKIYVGKTGMNFGDRWDSHKALLKSGKHDNPHLQNAWNKYGAENFEFFIIEECSLEQLNEREMYWIEYYRELDLSYNIHDGGDGGINLGKHLSAETKKKIGEKNKVNMTGRKASDETRKKMSESHKGILAGRKQTDEAKEINSLSHQKYAEEHPKKLTVEDVIAIRAAHNNGESCASIARRYNVSPQCINDICNYKRWKQIP